MSTQKQDGEETFTFLPMDLSGKLMIKAQLGDDARIFPLFNEDITYDELILMLQRVFKGKLNNTDEVTLKYKDEDGDLITIVDTSDLNLAKQRNRLLKIIILIKGREVLPLVDVSVVKEVRNELTLIRDKVNKLLEALDITGHDSSNAQSGTSTVQEPTHQQTDDAFSTSQPIPKGVTSLFDPLKSAPQTPMTNDPPSVPAVTTTPQMVPSSSYTSSSAASSNRATPLHDTSSLAGSTTHLFAGSPASGSFLPQQQPVPTQQAPPSVSQQAYAYPSSGTAPPQQQYQASQQTSAAVLTSSAQQQSYLPSQQQSMMYNPAVANGSTATAATPYGSTGGTVVQPPSAIAQPGANTAGAYSYQQPPSANPPGGVVPTYNPQVSAVGTALRHPRYPVATQAQMPTPTGYYTSGYKPPTSGNYGQGYYGQ